MKFGDRHDMECPESQDRLQAHREYFALLKIIHDSNPTKCSALKSPVDTPDIDTLLRG